MKRHQRIILPLTIFFIFFVVIGFRQAGSIYQSTHGKIIFKSKAPQELISASSNELVGILNLSNKNYAFKVNIHSFKGFNNAIQQEHFNENYMESDKYPEASFKGKIIEDVDFSKEGSYNIRTKGNLFIHGVYQERIIKAEVLVSKGSISIKSNFGVLLSDYNIPIPRVVYQKLANEIIIDVTAILQPR